MEGEDVSGAPPQSPSSNRSSSVDDNAAISLPRLVVNNMPDALVVTKGDGTIVHLNNATHAMFGFTKAELMGRNVGIIMPDAIAEKHDEYMRLFREKLRAGKAQLEASSQVGKLRELHARRKDGTTFPVELVIHPIHDPFEENALLIAGHLRDITERKLAQQAKQERDRQMAMRRMSEHLLGYINHEIRNPLHGIRGFIDLLRDELHTAVAQRAPVSPERLGWIRQDVGRLQELTAMLGHIVNDVLDLRKVEEGKLPLEIAPASINSLVHNACQVLRPKLLERPNVQLVVRLLQRDVVAEVDAHRVKQVLVNLLSNAIKYTERGHITVSVEPRRRVRLAKKRWREHETKRRAGGYMSLSTEMQGAAEGASDEGENSEEGDEDDLRLPVAVVGEKRGAEGPPGDEAPSKRPRLPPPNIDAGAHGPSPGPSQGVLSEGRSPQGLSPAYIASSPLLATRITNGGSAGSGGGGGGKARSRGPSPSAVAERAPLRSSPLVVGAACPAFPAAPPGWSPSSPSSPAAYAHLGPLRPGSPVSPAGSTGGLEEYLRITVQDTGCGIAKENQGHIFQPYQQVFASTTKLFQGTGLGLHLCHEITRTMDGSMGFSSEAGRGSTFWFEVPVKCSSPEALAPVPVQQVDLADFRSPHRFLVVDDIALNRSLIARFLRGFGAALVVEAANGQEAVDAVSNANGEFDLIFMDNLMPVKNGLEATREIRHLGFTCHIVGLTGNVSEESKREALQSGMTSVLEKPCSKQKLALCLSSLHLVAPAAPAAAALQ